VTLVVEAVEEFDPFQKWLIDPVTHYHATHGRGATCHAFRDGHDVRLHAEVLHLEPAAGAAETRQHLAVA